MKTDYMRLIGAMLVLLLSGVSCSGDPPTANDICQTVSLPLGADPAGPTVTDVALEPQTGDGVVVLATVTDPEGTENMRDVLQSIGVFPDAVCQGTPIVVQDDLACSGCEESFGPAVPPTNASLFNEIAAAQTWPVTLDFSDADGHRTQGRVLARVIH
jgi:hypothetical protein